MNVLENFNLPPRELSKFRPDLLDIRFIKLHSKFPQRRVTSSKAKEQSLQC
jgi:hypothetical protein